MLYFASVVSICDDQSYDTISYRINTYQDCAKSLAEEYQEESSLFYWELPSWKGLNAGETSRVSHLSESYALKTNHRYLSK